MFWASLAAQLPTLPLYVKSLGGESMEVGLVMGSFAVGLLLCRSYLGQVADRRGRVIMIWLGLAVACVVPMFYSLLRALPLLMVLRALHGVSIGAFATAYTAYVADQAPAMYRGEIIGYMSLVQPLGVGFGPAIGYWVYAEFGYASLFMVAAALAGIGLLAAVKLKESRNFSRSPQLEARPPLWASLRNPRVRVPALVLMLVGIIFGILSSFLPLIIEAYEIPVNAGIFYMTTALAGFIIRVPVSSFSDRFGRGVFISIGLCFYGLAMLMIATTHSQVGYLGAAVCEGIASGIVIPAMMTLLSDRTIPQERGFIFGIAWLGFDLGMATCSPIIGSLIRVIGLNGAFGIGYGMAILALLIFLTQSSGNVKSSFMFAIGMGKDQYAQII